MLSLRLYVAPADADPTRDARTSHSFVVGNFIRIRAVVGRDMMMILMCFYTLYLCASGFK